MNYRIEEPSISSPRSHRQKFIYGVGDIGFSLTTSIALTLLLMVLEATGYAPKVPHQRTVRLEKFTPSHLRPRQAIY